MSNLYFRDSLGVLHVVPYIYVDVDYFFKSCSIDHGFSKELFSSDVISEKIINDTLAKINDGSQIKENDKLYIHKTVNVARDLIRRKYQIVKNPLKSDYIVVDLSHINSVYTRYISRIIYVSNRDVAVVVAGFKDDTKYTSIDVINKLSTLNSGVKQFVKFDNNDPLIVETFDDNNFHAYCNLDDIALDTILSKRTNDVVDIRNLNMSIEGNDITMDNIDMMFAVANKDMYYENKDVDKARMQLIAIAALNWKDKIGFISRVIRYLKRTSGNYSKVIDCVSEQPAAIKNFIEVCKKRNDFVDENDLMLYQDWLTKILEIQSDKMVADIEGIENLMQKKHIPVDMLADAFDNRVLLKLKEFKGNKDETIQ